MVTGKDFVDAGYAGGKWFAAAIPLASRLIADGLPLAAALAEAARQHQPPPHLPLLAQGLPFHVNIEAETEDERANVAEVLASMTELMRTPVIKAGAIMPDSCPAGPVGTIPVGGIVASDHIHPGLHSADICCSMAISVFGRVSPRALLDAVEAVTHFGPGGRGETRPLVPGGAINTGNRFLAQAARLAESHFATQGDGNHFAFVGTLASTGQTALVTHHGSRGPGALLYKAGMAFAEKHRLQTSPETLPHNAWIAADTAEGDAYWDGLQTIRDWTKRSHFALHDLAASVVQAKVQDRFWNEHNFVFRKSDGLFYHAKGATPAFPGWASDATDLTIIPLNMAEPVLIVRGSNAPRGLGFSPHGAGRNFSRTRHKRRMAGRSPQEIFREETQGLDARFFMGITDVSELPGAYKKAETVRRQIRQFGLAEIVDEVIPYGCIMAGDWEQGAPWRKKRESKAG